MASEDSITVTAPEAQATDKSSQTFGNSFIIYQPISLCVITMLALLVSIIIGVTLGVVLHVGFSNGAPVLSQRTASQFDNVS